MLFLGKVQWVRVIVDLRSKVVILDHVERFNCTQWVQVGVSSALWYARM